MCYKFKMLRTYFLLSLFFFLFLQLGKYYMGFAGGSVVKNLPVNAGDMDLIPASERSPEKRKATPVFLPGKIHGQRSLAGLQSIGSQKRWTQLSNLMTATTNIIKYAAAYLNGLLLLKHNFQFNLQCENTSY